MSNKADSHAQTRTSHQSLAEQARSACCVHKCEQHHYSDGQSLRTFFSKKISKKNSRLRTFFFLSVPHLRKQHLEHAPQHAPLSVMLDLVLGGRTANYIHRIHRQVSTCSKCSFRKMWKHLHTCCLQECNKGQPCK